MSAATILPINADYAFRAGRALHMSVGPPVPLTDPEQIDLAVKLRSRFSVWYTLAIQEDPALFGGVSLPGDFLAADGVSRSG